MSYKKVKTLVFLCHVTFVSQEVTGYKISEELALSFLNSFSSLRIFHETKIIIDFLMVW